jgi:hypothetical protein
MKVYGKYIEHYSSNELKTMIKHLEHEIAYRNCERGIPKCICKKYNVKCVSVIWAENNSFNGGVE